MLTNRQLESQYWLALTAHREARDLGAFGMLAVMQVVMERVFDRSDRWPDNPPAVCQGLPSESQAFLDGDTLALELADLTLRHHVGSGHGLAFRYKKPTHYRALTELDANWAHEIQLAPKADVDFVGEVGRYVFYRS